MKTQAEYASDSKKVAIGILTEIHQSFVSHAIPADAVGEDWYRFLEQFQWIHLRHAARVAEEVIRGHMVDPPNLEMMINETLEALGVDAEVFQPRATSNIHTLEETNTINHLERLIREAEEENAETKREMILKDIQSLKRVVSLLTMPD